MANVVDGFISAVKGGGAEGMLGSIGSTLMMWFQILLWFVGGFFVIIFIWKFWFQYKIKVSVYKRVGMNSTEVGEDKAKIITDEQGKTKLILYKLKFGKRRGSCPLPEALYKSKSGSRDHYHVWVDDNFELHPIMPPSAATDSNNMVVIPQERSAWGRLEKDSMNKKFEVKNNMLKYAPLIGIGVVCITTFLIFFFFFKQMGGNLGALSTQMGQVASNCLTMTGGAAP